MRNGTDCQGSYLHLLCRSPPPPLHTKRHTYNNTYNNTISMIIIHSRPLIRTLARNSTQASLLAITRRTLTTTSNLNLHATQDPHAAPLIGADGKVLVGSKRSFQPHPTGKWYFFCKRMEGAPRDEAPEKHATEISISVCLAFSSGVRKMPRTYKVGY